MKAPKKPISYLPVGNTYALLAWFISPRKTEEQISMAGQLAAAGQIAWKDLLQQANAQVCTPLWYVQLKRDGMLGLLPRDLRDYLHKLHQANAARNTQMRQGLEELLHAFAKRGMLPLLLKGAATFCDNLYKDYGARVMGDLDILVKPGEVETARRVLIELGYREIPNPGMMFGGIGTDQRHHQLPRYVKPGTPVVVEIHFKVSYGRSGGVLAVDAAWKNTQPGVLSGRNVALLNPTWRLLHNGVHALIPHGEFIRGNISLLSLAEFVRLSQRYARQIDWAVWHEAAARHRLKTEMGLYLHLAASLMSMAEADTGPPTAIVSFHRRRVMAAMRNLGPAARRPLLPTLYYYLTLPRWVWDNVCYTGEKGTISLRLAYLLKKGLSARSRAKIGM